MIRLKSGIGREFNCEVGVGACYHKHAFKHTSKMSGRCKRPGGAQKGSGDQDASSGPPTKRRKCRPSSNAQSSGAAIQSSTSAATTTAQQPDDDDPQNQAAGAHWQPRPINDLKISSIYNR